MKIIADANIPYIKEYFGAYGELVLEPGRAITHSDVKDADVLLVRSITHVNKELLADTNVKFVGSVTAGADHLDTKWMDEAGVATGFNAPPVADYISSVIAAMQVKNLLPRDRFKAGVIGVGNVGRLVVERLQLLNADIKMCDPVRAQQEKDFVSTPLHELSDLDFVTVHVPLVHSGEHPTTHFIDKDFLQRQKPGCVLVNASRGAVISSSDLMQYGAHLHWCLDVWEHEPKINKMILEQTVIATPHIAGYSVQSKIRGIDRIYQIACEKNIIQPQARPPIDIPQQQLAFTGTEHTWQDIVLGVFNPVVITAMMRTILLPATDYGHLFDEMRNQFNYRHEFAYTIITEADIPLEQKELLRKFGLKIV
jgi:erythronate-4-phosphate dehydrogenase